MKKALRKEVLFERMQLSQEQVEERSQAIVTAVANQQVYQDARLVMFYLDFRKEVKMGELLQQALAAGKRVVVPITDIANKRLTPSEILDFPGDLQLGTYDILEPKADCIRPVDPAEIDLVLVPGVAFSPEGFRLGYGGGFYDRFLPRTKNSCIWMAPIFELQLKENVYPEAHDCQMHYVVTEERIIKCK